MPNTFQSTGRCVVRTVHAIWGSELSYNMVTPLVSMQDAFSSWRHGNRGGFRKNTCTLKTMYGPWTPASVVYWRPVWMESEPGMTEFNHITHLPVALIHPSCFTASDRLSICDAYNHVINCDRPYWLLAPRTGFIWNTLTFVYSYLHPLQCIPFLFYVVESFSKFGVIIMCFCC
jgi:hypothetical protein